MSNASVATETLPPADTCAEAVSKQAELIDGQDEVIALLTEQVAQLKLAIEEHKKVEMGLTAEVDGQVKVAETYKKLWQAEMEFTAAAHKRAVWAERFVALKWVGIGFAGGVLAIEAAK
jgi:hypothetical protein